MPALLVHVSTSGHEADAGALLGIGLMLLTVLVWFVVILAAIVVIAPVMLRAEITQDFAKSFDLGFIKRFLAFTWKETVLATMFLFLASFALSFIGALVFCVGMYCAGVITYFSWLHLQKQLYLLDLSRGGEPLPLSPKLLIVPRPLPA